MKLFEIYPYWYMAKTKEEAIRAIKEEHGCDELEIENVTQLSESDLDELNYYPDFDGSDKHISFRNALKKRADKDCNTARHFATNLAEL